MTISDNIWKCINGLIYEHETLTLFAYQPTQQIGVDRQPNYHLARQTRLCSWSYLWVCACWARGTRAVIRGRAGRPGTGHCSETGRLGKQTDTTVSGRERTLSFSQTTYTLLYQTSTDPSKDIPDTICGQGRVTGSSTAQENTVKEDTMCGTVTVPHDWS